VEKPITSSATAAISMTRPVDRLLTLALASLAVPTRYSIA
jgi:hypothetical protein